MKNHIPLGWVYKKNHLVLLVVFSSIICLSGFSQQKNTFGQENKKILSERKIEIPVGSTKIVRTLSYGRKAVLINKKWGFYDANDSMVISPQYDIVYDFKASVTAVLKDKKWYVIDKYGKQLTKSYFDYVGAFSNGRARVILKNQSSFIDESGKIDSEKWIPLPTNTLISPNNHTSNLNVGCPSNIDFELGDFTNWTLDTGLVVGPSRVTPSGVTLVGVWGASATGSNEIINAAVVASPLLDIHTILSNNLTYPVDIYGGFPVNSNDGSNSFIKLGSDLPNGGTDPVYNLPWPGAKSESVYYDLFVPNNTINLSFSYNYAIVLDEPIPVLQIDPNTGLPFLDAITGDTVYSPPKHYFNDKPRFKVEIIDLATNQVVPCGKVEYVADPSSAGAGGFQQSPMSSANQTIWYKPWSKRFVNLAPYHGKNIRIKFTTEDCTLGAHWGYAYLDIEGCLNTATAIRTCSTPVKTVLDGPAGFQTYEWYTSNFSTHLGSGIHLVSTSNLLHAGDTVNLISSPPPLPFLVLNCPDTLKVIVQGPSISFDAGPDKTICEGNPVTIGSAPLNNAVYSWSPAQGLNNTNTSLVQASPTNNTTYTVTVRDTATACVTSDVVNIVVKPSPHMNVNATPACHNQVSTITASGGDTYTWTSTGSLNINAQNPGIATITPSDQGDTIHLSIGLNSSGCIVDTTLILAAHPIPIVDFFVPPPQCLSGNQFYLSSGSFIFPGTIASNTWIINGTRTIFGADISASFPAVGIYPVKLISYSDYGCSDSATRNLEVLPMPNAAFSAPISKCLGNNSFNFVNTSSVSSGTITSFLWDFGDTHTASDTPAVHTYINTGSYTVQLIVISDNGCSDTTQHTVNVLPMPVVYFAQPDSQCLQGNNFTFTSQSTSIAPSTISTNNWYLGGSPLPLTGNSINHSFSIAGAYPIKLVSISSDGCADSITQILVVYPEPVSDFSLTPTICFSNNNTLFTSSSTVSTGYIDSCFWNFGDGTTAIGNSIRHPYTNSNILQYQVQLICQTNHGCRDTSQKSFQFLASPSVSLNPLSDLTICSGDSITLSATAQTPVGNITSYQWSVGGTDIPGENTPSITVLTAGIYQIHVSNTNNCFATSGDDTVMVRPLPEGNVVAPSNNYICEGGDKFLSCNANADSYQWYLNGNIIPGANSSSYLATLPGIYSVKLSSNFGCNNFATGSISISLRKKPTVNFDYSAFCRLTPIQFNNLTDISESGPVNWLWSFGDGTQSILHNPVHTYSQAGIDTVALTAALVDCPALITQNQQVILIDSPIAGIRYTPINTTKNTNTALHARPIANEYLWFPSLGLNSTAIVNPTFNYDDSMEYVIRLKNNAGCFFYDTLEVRIFEVSDFQVPSAFSPNGDGHNDKLDLFLIGIKELLHFYVFNRWGQLLFETTDPAQKWDGKFKGKEQPAETYVWLAEGIDGSGKKVIRRGQTILLR